MAKSVSSRILVADEADEQFAVIVRRQKTPGRGAAQLQSVFDLKPALGKSDLPGHPHPPVQEARSLIPLH